MTFRQRAWLFLAWWLYDTKQYRQIHAALTQTWHVQQCGECGATWWAIGPAHPELIRICDDCEIKLLDGMWEEADKEYKRQMKGAR